MLTNAVLALHLWACCSPLCVIELVRRRNIFFLLAHFFFFFFNAFYVSGTLLSKLLLSSHLILN